MGLYVSLYMHLLGFEMGTMLANFHMGGIMLLLIKSSFKREESESKWDNLL